MKMAVLLLWERSRGRASPVWGYIEQLPSSIDTPVRWSEAELAELQYAPAVNEVGCWHGPWFLARCLHPCRCVPNLLASAFAHLQAAPLCMCPWDCFKSACKPHTLPADPAAAGGVAAAVRQFLCRGEAGKAQVS